MSFSLKCPAIPPLAGGKLQNRIGTKILDVSFFIAVVQLILIIAYIAGADLGDLIARLPQTANAYLIMAIPIQLFQSLGNAGGGGGPQLVRPEMGRMEQLVKRFNVRKLEFCNLIAGKDSKDKTKLELEGTAA